MDYLCANFRTSPRCNSSTRCTLTARPHIATYYGVSRTTTYPSYPAFHIARSDGPSHWILVGISCFICPTNGHFWDNPKRWFSLWRASECIPCDSCTRTPSRPKSDQVQSARVSFTPAHSVFVSGGPQWSGCGTRPYQYPPTDTEQMEGTYRSPRVIFIVG